MAAGKGGWLSRPTSSEKEKFIEKWKVSRSAIKTIGSARERSETAAKKELISLYGPIPGLQGDIEKVFPDESMLLKALYDFSEIYDLWYTEVK